MKYCGKCGRELNPDTGLCPKCDRTKVSVPSDKKSFNKKLIIIPVAVLIICAVVVSCLSILGVIRFPSEKADENIRKISDDMYVSTPDPEAMQLDNETGIVYIDNEVLITFNKNTDRKTVDRVVESINGKIIGIISPTDTYQIQIESQSSFNSLEEVIDRIEEDDSVDFAGPNIIIVDETAAYYPKSDTEWADEWPDKGDSEIPSGHNWGVEAIKAPYAWDYTDEMKDVNVGVYDNLFIEHEDLQYEDIAFNSSNHTDLDYEHGTHVSGTIAAGFDNNKGVTGIAPKAKLYGWSFKRADELLGKRYVQIRNEEKGQYDVYNTDFPDINDFASLKLSMTYFIATKKCKVFNFSVGTEMETCYAASIGNQKALNYMNYCTKELEEYLLVLLHNGHDFTLVVAAGNENDSFFAETEESPRYPFGYKRVKESSAPSGVTMSKYSYYLNNIENEELKKRIIVVGAVKNTSSQTEEKYQMCSFSNIDNRVDVVAPGYDIQSTVDNNAYAYEIKPGEIWCGTSMAAPHVTGVVAILYSLNPDLPGDQVKSIIRDSTTIKVNGIGLVDAQAAVKKLTEGSISGRVVSSKGNTPIADVSVTVFQQTGNSQLSVDTTATNEEGGFSVTLPAGSYDLEFTKSGYKLHTLGITVENNVMTVLKDDIILEVNSSNFVSDKYLVEIDNEIYGVDTHGLWVNDAGFHKEYLTDHSATNIATDGQTIYYGVYNKTVDYYPFSSSSPVKSYQYDMYSYDLNTGKDQKVMSFVECGRPICANGDIIYYTDFPDDFDGNQVERAHGICSYNISTGEKKYIADGAHIVQSYDGKIFYRDIMAAMGNSQTHQIYCFDTATGKTEKISDGSVMGFKVVSGKLYYDIYSESYQNNNVTGNIKVYSYDITSGKTDKLYEKTGGSINVKDYDDKYLVYSERRIDGEGFIQVNLTTGSEKAIPPSAFDGDVPSQAMRDNNRTIFYTDYSGGRVYMLDDNDTDMDSTISSYTWQTLLDVKGETEFAVTKDSENYYFYYISCGRLS